MSHRSDCPDRWEAEREGREDAHRRSFADHHRFDCHEAQDAYEQGFRRESWREEERREEERREEEAAERRLQARREQEQAEEECWQQQQYWEPPPSEEPTDRDLCGANAHAAYPDATDDFGSRCYCGMVRWMTEESSS